jgi:hypothetical protein
MSVRRSIVAGLEVPEVLFPHSPDLFLGLVLPFLAEVAIIEAALTAYVYHGDNVGLFRSSAANRATYERQMDYIRRFVEERFGVQFLRYCGRSIYGPGQDGRASPGRIAEYLSECRQIAAAGVDPTIKRGSQAKLAASLLLPDVLYRAVRELRAKRRDRPARLLRRRHRQAGRQGGGL